MGHMRGPQSEGFPTLGTPMPPSHGRVPASSGSPPACCPGSAALRHSAATRDLVDAAVITLGCFGRFVAGPIGEWAQGSRLDLGCQWREGVWCMPVLLLSPMPLRLCGLGCSWYCERMPTWGLACAVAQAVRNQVQLGGVGGALTQQGCLRLVNQPPAVCEFVLAGWCGKVGNACWLRFVRLLGRILLRNKPIPKLPSPSGLLCMILLGTQGILSCLFASRFPCPVPRSCASSISIDGLLLSLFTWLQEMTRKTRLRVRAIRSAFVWPCYAFKFALCLTLLFFS
jgi:hypothetical protein